MICKIYLKDVSDQDRELLDYMFFHPLDKLGEDGDDLILNYGGGKVCQGCNDFQETCDDCRYLPHFVQKIVRKQASQTFGKVV